MKYCEQCGAENDDDARFCVSCGVELPDDLADLEYEGEDVEDEDIEDEVEDGDEELSEKDLDMSRGYYMTIDGRIATMFMDNGQMIRRFHMHTNVIQATTSGQTVAILTEDGYTSLYSWTGQLIRRTKR